MPRHSPTRPAVALLACLAAAGCTIEVSPESVPVPFSVRPTPSASAGVPAFVCTAAYKILTDGAVRLATFATSSGDAATEGMRTTFRDMAGRLDAEAAGTPDAALKQALGTVAADLTAAAAQPDPKAYVNGGFTTVSQKLDGACA